MSRNDRLRQFGHQLAATREALQRGGEADVERLLELARTLEAPLDPVPDQTARRAELIALLDEAGALRELIEQERDTLRQAIDGDARRRLGRAAYRLPRRG